MNSTSAAVYVRGVVSAVAVTLADAVVDCAEAAPRGALAQAAPAKMANESPAVVLNLFLIPRENNAS
jgi:hypothetical protein